MRIFLILSIICLTQSFLSGAELNNSVMQAKTKGSELVELKYKKDSIIKGASFYWNVEGKADYLHKNPSNSIRTALGDYPFIKITSSTPQLSFLGKISFPGNSECNYDIEIDLKDRLKGQAFFYAWLPSINLNGCRYEYLRNDSWTNGVMSDKINPQMSVGGWSVLRIHAKNKLLIEIKCDSGYPSLVRWDSAKKEKQSFRLTIFPDKKHTGKQSVLPQKIKINYSIKVTSDDSIGTNSDMKTVHAAVIGNEAAVNSGALMLMPISKITGRIKLDNLSGIKVYKGEKLLHSQLEDRNLNNKIDKYDLLVIEPGKFESIKWNDLRLEGIYGKKNPAFVKASDDKIINSAGIYFEKITPFKYRIGIGDNEKILMQIPSHYINAPANPEAKYIPKGTFITKGKLRTRIDVVFDYKGIPVTRSFAYNLDDKTITYSSAFWTISGWTKHFINITPEQKNLLPAIAYQYGDICFSNKSNVFYGDYGDVMAGLYKAANYSGYSCGMLAEILKGNAWSPRAGVSKNNISFFYTPTASSFYGKIQLGFNSSKKDFELALNRCKSEYNWNFSYDSAKLNKKLDADKKYLASAKDEYKQLKLKLAEAKANGLYTAACEIKLGTVKSWCQAADIDFKNCNLQRFNSRISKIDNELKEINDLLERVNNKNIRLPVPEPEKEFYFGVVQGSRNILDRDFRERYMNPARYAPLKIVGIDKVQYHSFNWNGKSKTCIDWVNMMAKDGMKAYPQLGMEHSPGFIEKYPEYIKFINNFKKSYELRFFSPKLHKNFKNSEKLTAEIAKYYEKQGKLLTQKTKTDLIFGVNEPTPLNFLYEGKHKETFLYGFKNYLKEKYSDIKSLNAAWDSSFKTFSNVTWDNEFLTEKRLEKGLTYLDGTWSFIEDPQELGIKEKWFVKPPAKLRKIKVPGYWERQIESLKGYNGIAWYFKDINLNGKKSILTFEAVDDNCTVYLNGKKIASNQGFNKKFSVEINESGLLAVRVEDNKMSGGIWRSVTLKNKDNNVLFPYYNVLRYPARCIDYYDYRNRVVADLVDLQVSSIAKGAVGKKVCIKEWTGSLNYMSLTKKCDPFYIGPISRGYMGWDIYSTDDEYTAYQATVRQSTGNNRPSIIGEFGLIGSGNSFNIGTGAIQNAPCRTYRLLGRNVRGIFYFFYGNLGACALVDADFSVPERLIKTGLAVRTLETLQGVFDSVMPEAEVGIYFSRNDGLVSTNDMVYKQLRGLFHLFYKNSINVEFVDTTTLTKRSKQLKVIFVPSSPFLSSEDWNALNEYRNNGGTLVVYANTGLMNLNNTKREKSICAGLEFNKLEPDLTLKRNNIGLNCYFGMKLPEGKTLLMSDDKKALLKLTKERLYLSNIDLGNAYREGNLQSNKEIGAVVKGILKKALVTVIFKSKIQDREIQILENKHNDVYVFVSSGNSELKNCNITFNTTGIDIAGKSSVLYDYLELTPAKLVKQSNECSLTIDNLKPTQQGIWLIGKSK